MNLSLAPSADEAPARKPSLLLLGTEPLRAAGEYLTHRLARCFQRPGPQGDGHPVVIFPGLASDGNAVAPLRDHCRSLGYFAVDWGRGFNTGPGKDVDGWLRELGADVRALLRREGFGPAVKPTLVGWSLGGIYARELAKTRMLPVRQVITIGTPFNGEPRHTHAGWVYELLNGQPAELDAALQRRLAQPPAVRTTSIYSRSDGVVAWQACRHPRPSRRVQDIEVEGSHLGMGWNPAVLELVAQRLALSVRQPLKPRPAGLAPRAARPPSACAAALPNGARA